MKFLKYVALTFLILIAIFIAAAFYVSNNLNSIVKSVIQSEGSKLTQTAVVLGQAKMNLGLNGAGGELHKLAIENPQGFEQGNIFSAEKLGVFVDPKSLLDEVIVVRELTIEGINLFVEEKSLKTNLLALKNNLDRVSTQEKSDSSPSQSSDQVKKRFMIESLTFADSAVRVLTERYGDFELTLPSFQLSELGDREQGLTPIELSRAVLLPILAKTKKEVENKLKSAAKDNVKSLLDEKLKEKLDENEIKKLDQLRGLLKR